MTIIILTVHTNPFFTYLMVLSYPKNQLDIANAIAPIITGHEKSNDFN